jgi:hypothetical protein
VCYVTQAQVEAGGLDVGARDVIADRSNHFPRDRLLEMMIWQHAG